jgi:hypothetical protein
MQTDTASDERILPQKCRQTKHQTNKASDNQLSEKESQIQGLDFRLQHVILSIEGEGVTNSRFRVPLATCNLIN